VHQQLNNTQVRFQGSKLVQKRTGKRTRKRTGKRTENAPKTHRKRTKDYKFNQLVQMPFDHKTWIQ